MAELRNCKPFSVQYTNRETGERSVDRPRLMVSVDGSERSLVIADDIVIAKGDKKITEAELWVKARLNIQNIK